jgi:Spy/CpxP family protein refolding chaperone
MKEKFFVIAAFVLTFAAGVFTGALVLRQFGGPPPMRQRMAREPGRPHGFMLEMLKPRLNLSDEQSRAVEEIIAKYEEQLRQHFRQTRPRTHQIIRQMTAAIDSVLTPEQRQKLRREMPRMWQMPPWPPRAQQDSVREEF